MTTAGPADSPVPPTTAPQAQKKGPWLKLPSGFLQPGSFSHTFGWTEKSGLASALLILIPQWVAPLHNLHEAPGWQIMLWGAFFILEAGWYPNAQLNGVQRAMTVQGHIDPTQVNRDYGWSILPVFSVGFMVVMTAVAIALIVFPSHVFDNEAMWGLRDRMILSPVMWFYCLFKLWQVKVDIGNGNTVLTQMAQLAGRVMRTEH